MSTPAAAVEPGPAAAPTATVNPWSARAQQALDEAGVPGAVIVIDLQHGNLLASAERAGHSPHPAGTPRSPGSTVKPLLTLAALHEQVLDPSETITCEREREIEGQTLTCYDRHGPIALDAALHTSCNQYAFELGLRLGLARVRRHFLAFGLGDAGGVIPEQPDTTAVAAVVATGHGGIRVSPEQLARAYAALATGTAPAGHADDWAYSSERLELVRAALHGVVQGEQGTGSAAAVPGLTILGKTGTTEEGEESEPYGLAWFAGWAPAQDPQIVVVVQLETNATGGEAAAPVARRLFEQLGH